MSLFAELQRRNVIRMAGLYLVGAWLVVQVAETVLPAFDIPGWVLRAVILVMALGFLPALAFAWVFELTPDGLKREVEVAPEQSVASRTGRRMDRLLLVVMAMALAYFAVEKFVLAPSRQAPAEALAAVPAAPAPAAAATAEAAAVSEQSIAVLPFANLSSDPDNAYFATGMQDEILTRLSKISALKVISRTSTMNLASTPANLPEIARMLGVSAILEGSVRKSGNTVRINVQLIRAATDEHLWAESYDRELDDVFAVQGEVARAVAEALSAALTGAESEAIAAAPTSNTRAYEFYLRGLAMEARYTDSANAIEQRVAAYQQAVDLDPDFALAWAGLCNAHVELYFGSDSTPARLAAARHALEQAQRLAPDSADTLAAAGTYLYLGKLDYDAAFDALSRALQSRPNDGLIVYMLGNVRRRQGQWLEGLRYQQQAAELDPLATNTWFNLGMTLRALRRYDEAQAAFDRGLAAVPGDPELLGQKFTTYLAAGDLDGADRFLGSLPAQDMAKPINAQMANVLRLLRRDYPPAIAAMKQLLLQPEGLDPIQIGGLTGDLGFAELLNGDSADGRARLGALREELLKLQAQGNQNPYLLLPLSRIYAALGDREAAYRLSDEAAMRFAHEAVGLPQAIDAQAYARMLGGDKAEAVALLRRGLALPKLFGTTAALLRIDPTWDPLRDTPGFAELLREDDVSLQLAPEQDR